MTMINLDLKLVQYFLKNERNIEYNVDGSSPNTVTWGGLPSYPNGIQFFKYHLENGDVLEFSAREFKYWQRHREYYNSPLYKALHEEA